MGVGNFNIPNQTIGGGSQFTSFLLDLLNQLGNQRNFRAGLGSDLFSNVLNRQLEAARSPINLIDRLLLSGEVGSINPLSQASQEQLGRFTSRPRTDLSGDLLRRLNLFTIGALTPEQQVQEGFDPKTGIQLTPKQRDFLRQTAIGAGRTPGQFADEPQRLAHGGSLRIDPGAAVSRGATVAGPATVVDRTGRRVALAGEAGQPEMLKVTAGATAGPTVAGGVGEVPGQRVDPTTEQLRRDEQFRFDEITRVQPNLSFEQRMNIARFPGGFEQFVGVQTDPRAAGARLLGGALSGDMRFRDPLVRSLSLGRAPSPAELNAEEFTNLSPDLQDALIAVVGPDLAQQFFFELQNFTPQGRRTRIAGPVAA